MDVDAYKSELSESAHFIETKTLKIGRLNFEKTKKKTWLNIPPQTFSNISEKMVRQKRPGVYAIFLWIPFFENQKKF